MNETASKLLWKAVGWLVARFEVSMCVDITLIHFHIR